MGGAVQQRGRACFRQRVRGLRVFSVDMYKKSVFCDQIEENAVYKRVQKRAVKKGGTIISDYEIIIPSLSKEIKLIKITARDPETKKRITILTNNLQWCAQTVASVYKDRWQVELFFKALKQNLRVKRFYGNSKNAVMTQI